MERLHLEIFDNASDHLHPLEQAVRRILVADAEDDVRAESIQDTLDEIDELLVGKLGEKDRARDAVKHDDAITERPTKFFQRHVALRFYRGRLDAIERELIVAEIRQQVLEMDIVMREREFPGFLAHVGSLLEIWQDIFLV